VIGAVLLAIAGGLDPCAAVEPAQKPDMVAAEAYLEVAEKEQRDGALDIAVAAYRSAWRADPQNAKARAGLLSLCRRSAEGNAFSEALRRMESGDRRGAIELFEQIRALGPDPASALLQGICHYELQEDEEAVPLFREAQRDPLLEPSAQLFLGLISLREGGGQAAATSFEAAAAKDPTLAPTATSLLRLARREGRVVLSLLAGPSGDSNVDLAPDGSPTSGGSADSAGTVAAGVLLRPSGESGPFVSASGTYRKLARFTQFDLGVVEGGTGWQLGREPRHVLVGYAYNFMSLGGDGYLSAHRLQAEGRWTFHQLSLAASYAVRFESFLTGAAAPYSGIRQLGELSGEWRLGGGSAFGLAYAVARDRTDDATLKFLEQGPRAFARFAATPSLRVALDAGLLRRQYDNLDPSLTATRADTYLDGSAAAELDVADRWTARFWVAARRSFSNVPDFAYTGLSAGLTLSLVTGLL
jgi:tetratricopeptide (TPR) repeat protein